MLASAADLTVNHITTIFRYGKGMYAAFDPSFKQLVTVAEDPLGEVALIRDTILRIIGVDCTESAKSDAHCAPHRRKSRFASLSSGLIRVEEKVPQHRLPPARTLGGCE